MDPTNFDTVAETATIDMIRALRERHRHIFLGRVQSFINEWKADEIIARIIANKMASKMEEVDFEKGEAVRNEMSGTALDDQQQNWDRRMEFAREGMRLAEAWRGKVQEGVEELGAVKIGWDSLWHLPELEFHEKSSSVMEIWSGILTRYSKLLEIRRESSAYASALCWVMHRNTMSGLRIVDNRERIEGDGGGMDQRRPHFTWVWFRND